MTAVSPLRVPVLMYHEIADATVTSSRLAVSPDAFAAQLACLRDAGFTTLTAGALSGILAGGAGELPQRPVVLTFDDGFGDFHHEVMPLLDQYGFTATLFMTTGWAGLGDETRRMLSWHEITEAARAGIEIAGHSSTHPQLDQVPEDLLREELYASKSLLEDKIGMPVPGLAYPFGYSNGKVRRMAREVGYAYGYAVDNAMTTSEADPFALPRLTVRRATTISSFAAMIGGQDTRILQWDRVLTSGNAVVRRAKAAARAARNPGLRPGASSLRSS
jgi:peptidoglycan/xylan/chitin deacetylase (PgdA/CDA1 family)